MGIHNIRDLLAVDRVRFRYLKSVGDKVRKEIRLKAKRLAQLRPDWVAANPGALEADSATPASRRRRSYGPTAPAGLTTQSA